MSTRCQHHRISANGLARKALFRNASLLSILTCPATSVRIFAVVEVATSHSPVTISHLACSHLHCASFATARTSERHFSQHKEVRTQRKSLKCMKRGPSAHSMYFAGSVLARMRWPQSNSAAKATCNVFDGFGLHQNVPQL